MKIKNVVPRIDNTAKQKGWAHWLVDTRPKSVAKIGPKGEKKYFETRAEAEEYAAEVNAAQIFDGGASSSRSGTIGMAIELLVESIKRRKTDGAIGHTTAVPYIQNTEDWGNHIGHIKCADLNHRQIQTVLDEVYGKLAYDTRSRKIKQLEKVLELARAKNWIPVNAKNAAEVGDNSAVSVVLQKKKHGLSEEAVRNAPRKNPFDPAVVKKMCDHMIYEDEKINKAREIVRQNQHGKIGHNQPLKPVQYRCYGTILTFAFQTGLRFGEQASLRWRDVDLINQEITVLTAVRIIDKGGIVDAGPTKGKLLRKADDFDGRRYVPISGTILKLLTEWKLKSQFSNPDDLVFPTAVGSWQASSNNWRNRIMHQACDAVGIDRIRWHDARHFFASMLIKLYGENWGKIAEVMGHASTDFTYRQYKHWIKKERKDQKEDADKFTAIFG